MPRVAPGCRFLARLIENHPTLTKLNIQDNDIGDEGAQVLAKASIRKEKRKALAKRNAEPKVAASLLFQRLHNMYESGRLQAIVNSGTSPKQANQPRAFVFPDSPRGSDARLPIAGVSSPRGVLPPASPLPLALSSGPATQSAVTPETMSAAKRILNVFIARETRRREKLHRRPIQPEEKDGSDASRSSKPSTYATPTSMAVKQRLRDRARTKSKLGKKVGIGKGWTLLRRRLGQVKKRGWAEFSKGMLVELGGNNRMSDDLMQAATGRLSIQARLKLEAMQFARAPQVEVGCRSWLGFIWWCWCWCMRLVCG